MSVLILILLQLCFHSSSFLILNICKMLLLGYPSSDLIIVLTAFTPLGFFSASLGSVSGARFANLLASYLTHLSLQTLQDRIVLLKPHFHPRDMFHHHILVNFSLIPLLESWRCCRYQLSLLSHLLRSRQLRNMFWVKGVLSILPRNIRVIHPSLSVCELYGFDFCIH